MTERERSDRRQNNNPNHLTNGTTPVYMCMCMCVCNSDFNRGYRFCMYVSNVSTSVFVSVSNVYCVSIPVFIFISATTTSVSLLSEISDNRQVRE